MECYVFVYVDEKKEKVQINDLPTINEMKGTCWTS